MNELKLNEKEEKNYSMHEYEKFADKANFLRIRCIKRMVKNRRDPAI